MSKLHTYRITVFTGKSFATYTVLESSWRDAKDFFYRKHPGLKIYSHRRVS